MKKIYSILFTALALFAFVPVINAQKRADEVEPTYGEHSINGTIKDPKNGKILEWPKDNGLHEESDFAYRKDVSAPQSDGTYWIKLESFSTGSASYIESAAPADIVLVLDLSSSMRNNYTSYTQTPYTPEIGYWTYNDDYPAVSSNYQANPFYYAYEYNGVFYRVDHYRQRSGGYGGNYYYSLTFTDDNEQQHWLLHGNVYDSWNDVPKNTNNNGESDNLWENPLTRLDGDETRLAALIRATKAFVAVIDHNDKYDDDGNERKINGVPTRLGNRISIVTFYNTGQVVVPLSQGGFADAGKSDDTHKTLAEFEAIIDDFENSTGSGTRQDYGIQRANEQLATISAARMASASRTVVVFTDGEPSGGWGWNAPSTAQLYGYGISNALTTKTKDNPETTDVVEGYDATVFTVGLFTSAPETDSDLWKFMNYMSSNAPTASSMTTPGSFSNKGFYKDASGANVDLSAVFTEIAHQSGGSTTSLSAASSNVDVVSNSFLLPVDASKDDIRVYVAKLETIQNGKYIFYEEYEKGYAPEDYTYYALDEDGERISDTPIKVDENIEITLETTGDSETPNTIKVTGFDYSSCFCGPVYKEGSTTEIEKYQGYKIIIMIPIHMNPDAVGGPNVSTNGAGSGIFVNDEATTAFIPYDSPTVSLPVNLHIKKTGLNPGESAKFSIERAVIPYRADGTWSVSEIDEDDWDYVSTVFVTMDEDATSSTPDPIVKVKGLPANIDVMVNGVKTQKDVVYRISEEPWGWSYEAGTGNVDPQYTVTSKVDNPFEFKNKKIEGIEYKVRHAESKATNSFDPDGPTVKYDDSKNSANRR